MKVNVTDANSSAQRHTKRLNRAIKVHVKERILVMPDASIGVGHLIAHEPDTIIAGIGLDLVHGCARSHPFLDSRLHTHGATGC